MLVPGINEETTGNKMFARTVLPYWNFSISQRKQNHTFHTITEEYTIEMP
tara:strand:+ start:1199 stop:1348 length:150 start_codon:yes stop_codon:yes gene_type:complete